MLLSGWRLGRLSAPGEGAQERDWEVLIECPLRSHQIWLKGIQDSSEGGRERLLTVLKSTQIPPKSLHITLIKLCAAAYTNSYWSYHKATIYVTLSSEGVT